MIRPCPIYINGCPGVDSPITNTSSEAPDPLLFAGIGWSQYNPFAIPPLGDGPAIAQDCFNVSYSAESQALADFLALNNARACTKPGPGTGADAGPDDTIPPFNWTPPDFVPLPGVTYQEFMNDPQTATVSCPNGAVFSYTVPAGTILSGPLDVRLGPSWIEYANALAFSWALQNVWALRVCVSIDLKMRQPPTVPPSPLPTPTPPGTIPAGPGGPAVSANPGYCCFGASLIPELNTYEISGSNKTYTFSASGNVPPGCSLVQTGPQSAVMGGDPSIPGNYSYSIRAVQNDNPGISIVVPDNMFVMGVAVTTLPNFSAGTPYSPQPIGAQGGAAPLTYSVAPGSTLPPGFSLSSDG